MATKATIKPKILGFRATEAQIRKLDQLSEQTGLKTSELLRELVDSAVISPIWTTRTRAEIRTGK